MRSPRSPEKRISVGSPGSGTNMLATQLLRASEVTAENSTLLAPADQSLGVGAERARDRRRDDRHRPARGSTLRAALADPSSNSSTFAQADAYPQSLTFITRRTLHAGAVKVRSFDTAARHGRDRDRGDARRA